MKFSQLTRRFGQTLAIATLAAGIHAGPAAAATFDAGTLTATPYVYSSEVVHGSFADVFNFDVPPLAELAASAVSLDLKLGTLDLLHIGNLAFSLFDSANKLIASSSGNPLSLQEAVSNGSYHVTVSGTADGISGGTYVFSVAALPESVINAAPVPEPQEWMLLLSGLMFLGTMARRRMDRM